MTGNTSTPSPGTAARDHAPILILFSRSLLVGFNSAATSAIIEVDSDEDVDIQAPSRIPCLDGISIRARVCVCAI